MFLDARGRLSAGALLFVSTCCCIPESCVSCSDRELATVTRTVDLGEGYGELAIIGDYRYWEWDDSRIPWIPHADYNVAVRVPDGRGWGQHLCGQTYGDESDWQSAYESARLIDRCSGEDAIAFRVEIDEWRCPGEMTRGLIGSMDAPMAWWVLAPGEIEARSVPADSCEDALSSASAQPPIAQDAAVP